MATERSPVLRRWLVPPISREHGATITLLVCFLLGAWIAGGWNGGTWLALLAVLAGFEAQAPAGRLVRQRRINGPSALWLAIYSGVALLSAGWLWQQTEALGRIYAVVLGALAINLLSVLLKKKKSIPNELVIFLALTLALPFAYTATTGLIPQELLGLWLLAALVFSSSIFTVRLRLEGEGAMAAAAGYHIVALALAFLLVRLNLLEPALAWTLLLPVAKLVLILANLDRYRLLKLTRIGLWETALAIVFGLWVGALVTG